MHISYRTRRALQRLGVIALILLILLILGWLCWVVWLERYVVYTRDGAVINFDLPAQLPVGQLASPPSDEHTVEIYYNEGLNAMETNRDLTQLRGYYIDRDALSTDLASCRSKLGTLESNTPIMIDLKNIDGTFNYSSELMDASYSESVDIVAVDDFIKDLTSGKFYSIARISAFRDRSYFLINNANVAAGLPMAGRGGVLWPDEKGCYWFNPTNTTGLNRLIQIIEEVKNMGFNEVVLSEFRFPSTDKIVFSGDKNQALQDAMNTILEHCATDTFTISFTVSDPSFALPEGSRTRIYLDSVSADRVGAVAAQVTIPDPTIRLVFVSSTNDTRYDEYGVLRPISASDVLENME